MKTKNKLHVDFETRSTIDLKKTTTDVYAKHPTTDAWCMSFTFNDEDVHRFIFPLDALPERKIICETEDPERVYSHIESGGLVYGHNVPFEWNIWNKTLRPKYGYHILPGLRIEQCRCTMAMAYAMALPGSLEKAAAAVGLPMQKDMKGQRLMLKMAKPRKITKEGIIWWDSEEERTKLYDYCDQDVETERALDGRLRELNEFEQKLWFIDQKINERGVHIDVESIKKAQHLVEVSNDRINKEINEVSDGWVGSYTYINQITDYLKMNGIETGGIAKADVDALLARDDLTDEVRRVLELRQAGAKTSTAKLNTMLNCVSEDNRLRGMFQYHGAGPGRWAGRKVQLHNLPRPKFKHKEIEDLLDNYLNDYDAIDVIFDDPRTALASCLRGVITAAPGNELTVFDWSNIEGRMLAWLAGEEWKLEAFRKFDRGDGPDLYKVTAGGILGISPYDVDGEQRQTLGKVPELALGYEGGVGAFQQMAKGYGVNMADHADTIFETMKPEYIKEAESNYYKFGRGSGLKKRVWVATESIKVAWRDKHPAIRVFWKRLNQAAIDAVLNPGQVFKVGYIRYVKKGSFLWCQLPSKRLLCYPYPEVRQVETPWRDSEGNVVYQDKLFYKTTENYKWTETDTYGGKLSENVTQAAARDILAEAIVNLEKEKYPVVLHVHDEPACEASIGHIKMERMEEIVKQNPVWAKGLPIAVEGWQGKRYRK